MFSNLCSSCGKFPPGHGQEGNLCLGCSIRKGGHTKVEEKDSGVQTAIFFFLFVVLITFLIDYFFPFLRTLKSDLLKG